MLPFHVRGGELILGRGSIRSPPTPFLLVQRGRIVPMAVAQQGCESRAISMAHIEQGSG